MPDKRTQELMDRGWAELQGPLDQHFPRPRRRRRWYWLSGLVALLLMGGCGGWWLWQSTTSQASERPRARGVDRTEQAVVPPVSPTVSQPTIPETSAPTTPALKKPEQLSRAPITGLPNTESDAAPAAGPIIRQGVPRSRTLTVPPSIDPPLPAAYAESNARIIIPPVRIGPSTAAPNRTTELLSTLPFLALQPLGANTDLAPPDLNGRARRLPPLQLEAGAVATAAYPATGAYVGFTTRLPLGGRWNLRTGLGFTTRALRSYVAAPTGFSGQSADLSSSSADLNPAPTVGVIETGQNLSASGFSAPIYLFSGQSVDSFLTGSRIAARGTQFSHSLFLPVNLEYQLSPRWRTFAGGSVRYTLTSLPGSIVPEFYGSSGSNEALNLMDSTPSVLQRWNLRAQAGATFAVSPRWSINTSVERDLRSRFASFLRSSDQPIELRLGVRYGLQ